MNESATVSQTDLLLIITAQSDALGTHIAIFLTLVTAYLVVAYLVGTKLTRAQVSVATSIYLIAYIFESIIMMAIFRSVINGIQRYRERFTVYDPESIYSIVAAGYIGVAILTLILMASLWFMWSIRHPKSSKTEHGN